MGAMFTIQLDGRPGVSNSLESQISALRGEIAQAAVAREQLARSENRIAQMTKMLEVVLRELDRPAMTPDQRERLREELRTLLFAKIP